MALYCVRAVTSLFLLCVALLSVGASAGIFSRSATKERTHAPLADLVPGRWRFDAPDDDVSDAVKAAIAARASDSSSILATGEAVVNAAVSALIKQRTAFIVELAQGLHDGVFVGRVMVEQHGWDYFHDLFSIESASAPPPLVSSGEFTQPIDIVVQCFNLMSCTASIGTLPDDGAASDTDGAAQPAKYGRVAFNLQRRPDVASWLRLGSATWTNANASAQSVGARVTLVTDEGLLVVMSPPHRGGASAAAATSSDDVNATAPRAVKRLVGLRVLDSLTKDEEEGWSLLGRSWKSVVFYAILMLVVVGGRWVVKWYFRRQGIDVEQFMRNIRGGKRGKAQLSKRGEKNFTDEEIRAMMAEDNAADAWWKKGGAKPKAE